MRMTDEVWRRDEIESPCVKLCVLHPGARICVGCHRTVAEIAGWTAMTPEARRAVMAELPARAGLLTEPGNRPSARRRARS
jgi:predicted Fe-S protein YdhL (DUF1289 family)